MRAEYIREFGEEDVLVFEKSKIAKTFDEGDNFTDRRAIVYARNACFDLARQQGYTYFLQLDDDYQAWLYRIGPDLSYHPKACKSLDSVFDSVLSFYQSSPFLSVCIAQGGDYIGGVGNEHAKHVHTNRKGMNTFFCSTERPFQFFGRINEDVNAYTCLQRRGGAFMTVFNVSMDQAETQSNEGGMTDIYIDGGTYIKSFYSVMYAPSCVHVGIMGRNQRRLHHSVAWNNCAPVILPESARNTEGSPTTTTPSPNERTVIEHPILAQAPKQSFEEFIARCSMYPEVDVALIRRAVADPSEVAKLQDRWYESLSRGDPDFDVYGEDLYMADLWTCWATYSRAYLRNIQGPQSFGNCSIYAMLRDLNIRGIADLGCGIAQATIGLCQMFPDVPVTGTNLSKTFQRRLCEDMGKSFGYQVRSTVQEIDHPVDLVFASEYFEHFERPVQHIEEVVECLFPKALLIASTFGAPSIGHFNTYIGREGSMNGQSMSRAFNGRLRELGYQKQKTRLWNNRPAVWTRKASSAPKS